MTLNQGTDVRSGRRHTPVRKDPILDYLSRWARATVIAVALVYLAGLFGQLHWLADLCANFVPYLTVVTFGCALIFVFARWLQWAVGATVLLAAEFVVIAPYLIGNGLMADATGAGAEIRVLQFNVSSKNKSSRNFIDWLRPQVDNFDIIVLLENTPSWGPVINALGEEFPAHLEVARTDSWGIAVFSRLPDSQFKLRPLGSNRVPVVELRAHLGERSLTVIAAHTYAPLGRKKSEERNAQLQELTKWVADAPPGYKVLLGDLNLTPFSPWFRGLLEATGLSDAQYGLGLLPTWAPRALPTALGLPIDHTLISNDLSVINRRCDERFGSDHCPITTELRGNR